jgi:uncharacterized protein with HEPN domain
MRRADQIRLRHMLDGATEALSFAEGKRREDLAEDRLLVLGLVKAIEIIGEAAYQVSADTRESLPQLPWEDIIGMRHRLVHAYFDINLDVLWRTVRDDLPSLVAPLEKALEEATSGF